MIHIVHHLDTNTHQALFVWLGEVTVKSIEFVSSKQAYRAAYTLWNTTYMKGHITSISSFKRS